MSKLGRPPANEGFVSVLARAVVGGVLGFAGGYVLVLLASRFGIVTAKPVLDHGEVLFGTTALGAVAFQMRRTSLAERTWVRRSSPLVGAGAGFVAGCLVLYVILVTGPLTRIIELRPGEKNTFDQEAYVAAFRRVVLVVMASSIVLGVALATWWSAQRRPGAASPALTVGAASDET